MDKTLLRSLIENKQMSTRPVYGTVEPSIMSGRDSFPYGREWQGYPRESQPRISCREAGWNPMNNSCYVQQYNPVPEKHMDWCFQPACSTNFPPRCPRKCDTCFTMQP